MIDKMKVYQDTELSSKAVSVYLFVNVPVKKQKAAIPP